MHTDRRLRKKRAGRAGGLMCFAGIIALAMAGQWTGPVTARVERVVDGDTRVVRYPGGNRTVRLIGVDMPESVHPARPVEHFGLEASGFARSRLDGKTVQFVRDRTGDTVDAYGRLLRLVYLDGENFNATLIREGYGYAIRGFDYSMRREFIALENQARIQRRGLWAPRQDGLWLRQDVGGPPLPDGRAPRRLAQSGHTILGVGHLLPGSALAWCTPNAGASQGAAPWRVRQSSVCPARSIGWVPTMCRLPLEGTVARRTPARAGTRFAASVSRAALCRAVLSSPPA